MLTVIINKNYNKCSNLKTETKIFSLIQPSARVIYTVSNNNKFHDNKENVKNT